MRLRRPRQWLRRATTAAAATAVRAQQVFRAAGGAPPRVLLVAKSSLAAEALRETLAVLPGDRPMSCHLTTPDTLRSWRRRRLLAREGGPALARSLGVEFVPFRRAIGAWWDLALFANHDAPWYFHRDIPKIRVRHGFGAKLVDGVPYVYHPRWTLRPDGAPVYTRIFEASAVVRDRVVARYPALRGCVAVVGSLRADALLALADERPAIRRRLGVAEAAPLVLLTSTQRAGSLIETLGEPLLAEAERLMARRGWRFAVSVHPTQWRRQREAGTSWGDWLRPLARRGFIVAEPHRDLVPLLVAADVMVVDHSSVSALWGLLRRPLVAAPAPAGALDPESFPARLRASAPQLERADQLEAAIRAARAGPAPDLAAAINTCPGEAASRIRAELRRVLR